MKGEDTMKRFISLLLFLLLGTFPINLFAFQNEPDGFRGIKWGTKIETLSDMISPIEQENFVTYTRANDKMKMGNATLQTINYVFWKGQFSGVVIICEGSSNWYILRAEVFTKFGRRDQYNKDNKEIEEYKWGIMIAGKTCIILNYNKSSKKTKLNFYSSNHAKMQFDEEGQKAKKATKGEF